MSTNVAERPKTKQGPKMRVAPMPSNTTKQDKINTLTEKAVEVQRDSYDRVLTILANHLGGEFAKEKVFYDSEITEVLLQIKKLESKRG